jgi:hypothetical protein
VVTVPQIAEHLARLGQVLTIELLACAAAVAMSLPRSDRPC